MFTKSYLIQGSLLYLSKMTRKILLGSLVTLTLVLILYSYFRFRDRHPGYWLNLDAQIRSESPLRVGFAKGSITPRIMETWNDANSDGHFRPEDGDTFDDVNQNGRFDAVWIAGFHNQRPAQGIHDSLWARAMVIQKDTFTMAVIAIDAIGLGSDEILHIRKGAMAAHPLDYVIVASTHSHQTPDLIGMWGPSDYRSGVDPSYRALVIAETVKAVGSAYNEMTPARLHFAENLTIADELVEDSRKPIVKDAGLRVLVAEGIDNNQVLGSLVGWANHPETLWSDNLMISSDFPHYLRTGIESGVWVGDSLLQSGIGGVSIFLNGAIGGLMTSSPRMSIRDPWRDTSYLKPSFEKAKAQGDRLAHSVLKMLGSDQIDTLPGSSLTIMASSIILPMKNRLFRLGAWLGILDRGMSGWFSLRSEVAYWQLDQIGFLHVPGEIYPEIINGGIESPPGQDFPIDPVEIPPLRELLPCKSAFVVGLSNDMIGYIIPKSEWDEHPPYLYHEHDSPYGEINSLGPETAPIIHSEIFHLISDMKQKYSLKTPERLQKKGL